MVVLDATRDRSQPRALIMLLAAWLLSMACWLSAGIAAADDSVNHENARISEAPRAAGRSDKSLMSSGDGFDDTAMARRFENASLVALVKITGIHRMIDNALSEPGMVAIMGYVYSGVTQKVWKGEAGTLLAFRVTLDACGRKLKGGEQYLIFAGADSDGRLGIGSCDAIISGVEADSLLVYLPEERDVKEHL